MTGRLVPLYRYDNAFIDYVTAKRAERLAALGRATIVRHKKGAINRVILLRGKDDPHATTVRDYMGRQYSFEQPLSDGHHCWKLRPLQGGRSEVDLAPESVRPIFIRVLLDCLTPAV